MMRYVKYRLATRAAVRAIAVAKRYRGGQPWDAGMQMVLNRRVDMALAKLNRLGR